MTDEVHRKLFVSKNMICPSFYRECYAHMRRTSLFPRLSSRTGRNVNLSHIRIFMQLNSKHGTYNDNSTHLHVHLVAIFSKHFIIAFSHNRHFKSNWFCWSVTLYYRNEVCMSSIDIPPPPACRAHILVFFNFNPRPLVLLQVPSSKFLPHLLSHSLPRVQFYHQR